MNAGALSTTDDRRPDSPAHRVDAACDRFEVDWREGRGPRIEEALAAAGEADRAELLCELIALERELRRRGGERPVIEEYLERFPGYAGVVHAGFGAPPGAGGTPAARPRGDTGRNLLFGILALQNNFIGRDDLLAAFAAWVADKTRPLAQLLVNRGALDEARRMLLEALVAEHLKQHGGDAEASLAAVSPLGSVRDDLERLGDADIQASFAAASSRPARESTDVVSTLLKSPSPRGAAERFRILRFHKQGGLGRVYVARDEELGREVALKEVRPDKIAEADLLRRFILEAEINGGLEHPGIVPVYSLGTYVDGRPFYAMRFVAGDSLMEAIAVYHKERPRPDPTAVEFRKLLGRFVDVCEAIAFAHSKGVLHRDLKPHNVMLGRYGETLLIDWGLAKATGRRMPTDAEAVREATLVPPSGSGHAPTHGVLGSPPYMSPEQARGEVESLGPATDIYGLGAILFALLTGEPPVESGATEEMLDRARRGVIRLPRSLNPNIPRALEAVCLKALTTHPEDRYATALALAEDIEHWLADEPVSAWREPVAVRMWRWTRRHRTAASAIASGLAIALLSLGVGLWYVDRERWRRAEDSSIRILTVDLDKLEATLTQLEPDWVRVGPLLRARWDDPNLDPSLKLKVALAMARDVPGASDYLRARLLKADPRSLMTILAALRKRNVGPTVRHYWSVLEDPGADADPRFRAACALAALDPPRDPSGAGRWEPHAGWLVDEALKAVVQRPDDYDAIERALAPLGKVLFGPMARRHRAPDTSPDRDVRRAAEASLLRAWATGPEEVAVLILDADEAWDVERLMQKLAPYRDPAMEILARAGQDPAFLFPGDPPADRGSLARRRARAFAALARLGEVHRLWPVLRPSAGPDLRSELVSQLGRFGVDPHALIEHLREESDPSVRLALILAFGGDRTTWAAADREAALKLLVKWYGSDPHPGIHSAINWLLRTRWDQGALVAEIDRSLRSRDPRPDRDWYVDGSGQTFVIVRGPKRFQMGLPPDDDKHREAERHLREIPHSFAIATTEVTVAQFRAFVDDNPKLYPDGLQYHQDVSPQPDCPIHGVNWFDAVAYCRWRSDKERIPDDEKCFPPLSVQADASVIEVSGQTLRRTGHRLPTEAEWESACRAGTDSIWFFGDSPSLLPEYAWLAECSGRRSDPVGFRKPNDLGLFDVAGNVREWCLDPDLPYPRSPRPSIDGRALAPVADPEKVPNSRLLVTRGGSFHDPPNVARSAARNRSAPNERLESTGFRVARTVK